MTLEDLVDERNQKELERQIGKDESLLMIHEVCKGFTENVIGTPKRNIEKARESNDVLYKALTDLGKLSVIFPRNRYCAVRVVIGIYILYLCEFYRSEPN
ncbi:hypothetical protein KW796_03085 [Candidatus Parcubacteria bacterium]|nr:hypothetical protein [Candidatus Parcubacteria bacterium]